MLAISFTHSEATDSQKCNPCLKVVLWSHVAGGELAHVITKRQALLGAILGGGSHPWCLLLWWNVLKLDILWFSLSQVSVWVQVKVGLKLSNCIQLLLKCGVYGAFAGGRKYHWFQYTWSACLQFCLGFTYMSSKFETCSQVLNVLNDFNAALL